MSVQVVCEWESTHEVVPPDGMDEETFSRLLSEGDDEAWGHALDQTDAHTAALLNWELR